MKDSGPRIAPIDRHDAGLTLAELLIALAIMALLATMWSAALGVGSRVWSRTSQVARALDDVQQTQRFLRTLLAAAVPLSSGGANPPPELAAFVGEQKRIAFLALLPEPFALAAPASVTASFEPDVVGERLVLDVGGNGSAGTSQRIVLLSRVRAGTFVFSEQTDNGKFAELPAWDGRADLPSLVRVRVVFEDGDDRVWPDFLVRTRRTAPPLCDYDPVNHGCGRSYAEHARG